MSASSLERGKNKHHRFTIREWDWPTIFLFSGEHHALDLLKAGLQLRVETLQTDIDTLLVQVERLLKDGYLRSWGEGAMLNTLGNSYS